MSRSKVKRNKILMSMLTAVILSMMMLSATVGAVKEFPDLSKKGSVTVTMKYEDKLISGGEITLYPIANAVYHNGDYSYEYTNGFENCGIELGNLQDTTLASQLEGKITASTQSVTQTVGENGQALFSDLTPGLYLLRQTKGSNGYLIINSFLVSVPRQEGETWIYDVDAAPKMEVSYLPDREGGESEPETEKTTETESESETNPSHSGTTTSSGSSGSSLPQTGQLDWPIPVLAVMGLFLILAGVYLMKERKAKCDVE